MNQLLEQINVDQMIIALNETLFMTFTSLALSVVFGLIIGVLLFSTQSEGLYKNKILNAGTDFIINVLRAIPFIIILILVIPFTKMLVGTMLGAKAAIPSLVIAATPFYARLAVIAFTEVDKGTIEASKAMGASRFEIITKVLIPEALPALVSGICVTGISLVGYTAMAGAIGAGGLGNLAYLYGFARRDNVVLFSSTVLVIIIVFVIQGIGDYIVKRIDKR
ncbi:methionine ABC transporter permease [Anaerorhabdus furcosa]|uniref:D-methionine transport system permease protein n=1 Tax=Anaerorhabdus furcosa TaxID=118967 RepID=A0A1T4N8W0_9FIRM|nr:methionine ABC transporter permease [Anaerorhabdus furcosa]SJZ75556.1 D-methionine transport system permease protein [Anaerorhabdus furcosa]